MEMALESPSLQQSVCFHHLDLKRLSSPAFNRPKVITDRIKIELVRITYNKDSNVIK